MKSRMVHILILLPALMVFSACNPRGISSTSRQGQPTIPFRSISPGPVESSTSNSLIQDKHKFLYLIALEDQGSSGYPVGCGDNLVEVAVPAGSAQEALNLLLNNHNQWYGESGLYNALYQSNLSVSRWEQTGDGIEIDLSGSLILGGVCDNPRVKAQMEATIRQSMDEKQAVLIRINGIPLDDYLSGK